MQIVNDRVCLLDTMKGKVSRRQEVIERFGVPPEQVLEILGLAGDTSDNIPGVPGIGEKTAAGLIQEFGSIENLLQNIDQVKGNARRICANSAIRPVCRANWRICSTILSSTSAWLT